MKDSLVAKSSIVINAPASKVWEALTTPEIIKQYLFGTDVSTDWQVGSPITYKGVWEGKEYQDRGIILEVVPNKIFVSTYWSSMGGLPDKPENYKKVTYELIEGNEQTTLNVFQDNNASETERAHSENNWDSVLKGIKKIVES